MIDILLSIFSLVFNVLVLLSKRVYIAIIGTYADFIV